MMKHRLNILLLSFLFTSFILHVHAQDPHPVFRQYTVEDGLPNSDVYQVKQDTKGYMWFATGTGVSRFNGYEFENFSVNNGLPDNTVFDIFEDHTGRIWFVPLSCKLSYYYQGKIYPFKYNDALQKQLKNPVKLSFYVDHHNTIFLSVAGDGLYKIDSNGKIIHSENSTIDYEIYEPEPNHFIYSSSLCYTGKIKFNTNSFKAVINTQETSPRTLLSARTLKTKDQKILVACKNKLYIFSRPENYRIKIFPDNIIWLYEDRDENIWIGTYRGVFYLEKNHFEKHKTYLHNISVNSVTQDLEGGFWFATEGNGVFYTPSEKVLIYDHVTRFIDSKISCLATNGTTIYAGAKNGFIYAINKDHINIYNTNKDQTNYINCLYYDHFKDRLIILGSSSGGFIKKNKFSFSYALGSFLRLIIDEQQNYWIVNMMGMSKKINDRNVWNVKKRQRLITRVNAIVKINPDELYLGTVDGLWKYNDRTEIFTHQKNIDPLFSTRILDLEYTADHLLIIATKGKGLVLYDHKNVCQITTEKGLCGNNVYNLWIDGTNIWVATDKGLNKLTIHKNNIFNYDIKNYNNNGGLLSGEINDVLKLNDQVWVATNKGLSVFKEKDIPASSTELPVYFLKLFINDSVTDLQKKYILDHSQNRINISFAGIGYKNAKKHTYRYKMEGLDTGWTYTRTREVQFTTLPPGHYTFIVAVQNVNGTWSNQTGQLEFVITPPLWQRWWFILLASAFITLMISLLFRYRLKILQERKEKNAELNRTLLGLRLKALRAQMNPHFLFNVINSIQHFIIHKNERAAHEYLAKFSKLVRAILNNSEDDTIPLDEEIKALKLYLELEMMRFEQQFEYEIIIGTSIDTLSTKIPSMLIQPYVENAIKHGILPLKTKGKILIEIQKENGFLKCIIEDNGIGRAKAAEQKQKDQNRSFGIPITKERLITINQLTNSRLSENIIDMKDENETASGTRVELYIPVNYSTYESNYY
jgi:ligand-binding sensor domain-containing protein